MQDFAREVRWHFVQVGDNQTTVVLNVLLKVLRKPEAIVRSISGMCPKVKIGRSVFIQGVKQFLVQETGHVLRFVRPGNVEPFKDCSVSFVLAYGLCSLRS